MGTDPTRPTSSGRQRGAALGERDEERHHVVDGPAHRSAPSRVGRAASVDGAAAHHDRAVDPGRRGARRSAAGAAPSASGAVTQSPTRTGAIGRAPHRRRSRSGSRHPGRPRRGPRRATGRSGSPSAASAGHRRPSRARRCPAGVPGGRTAGPSGRSAVAPPPRRGARPRSTSSPSAHRSPIDRSDGASMAVSTSPGSAPDARADSTIPHEPSLVAGDQARLEPRAVHRPRRARRPGPRGRHRRARIEASTQVRDVDLPHVPRLRAGSRPLRT